MGFNDKRSDNNKILTCLNVKFFLCTTAIGEIANNRNLLSMNSRCKVMILLPNNVEKFFTVNCY